MGSIDELFGDLRNYDFESVATAAHELAESARQQFLIIDGRDGRNHPAEHMAASLLESVALLGCERYADALRISESELGRLSFATYDIVDALIMYHIAAATIAVRQMTGKTGQAVDKFWELVDGKAAAATHNTLERSKKRERLQALNKTGELLTADCEGEKAMRLGYVMEIMEAINRYVGTNKPHNVAEMSARSLIAKLAQHMYCLSPTDLLPHEYSMPVHK